MTVQSSLEANFTHAHFHKGYALLQASQFENAILEFDRTLGIDPNFADAHYNRGIALASFSGSTMQLFRLIKH